jgi:RNA polymerase sigma-70 factor (ECF subfamily)
MLSRIVSSGAAPVAVPGLSADHVAIVAALRRLPPEQREAIALHHVADLGVRQIAELLGVPEGTVKARLARGRAKLAPLVDDLADEPTGPVEPAEPAREADHA